MSGELKARVLALLRGLSTERCPYYWPEPHCPCCGRLALDLGHTERYAETHLDDCELAAVLAELEANKP